MAGRAFISRFSPNRTDPAVLEAIFVQRHRLADVWLELLRDSILTGAKHHLLAVGPRGCGKSHLVSLLVHRLRKDSAVAGRVRIAWLPEDEATSSFWKLLLRMLRALGAEYADEFPRPPHDQLENADDERRTAVLSEFLLKRLNGRTLLLVVENLDDVMRGLKDEGQKRWRAFLQEHAVAATLATSQQLTEDVSDHDRPFFNFFQIEHLKSLSADEALLLLQKLADFGKNAELSGFLHTPTGRARVRAIRHLAGGGHRVFIILSEFATQENLDNLVGAFEGLLDELTPYYQERLRWLPDQQREIVEFLCRQARTVPVKQIASELFISEQTAAAQLKSLKDKGYVTMESVGRESRYELAEPLMRLCVEVKDPRREPIRLVVEFLRVWYDAPDVEHRLRCLSRDADLERRYLEAVRQLAEQPGIAGPVDIALNRDLEAARIAGDTREIVRILHESSETARFGVNCAGFAAQLIAMNLFADALTVLDRAIILDPAFAPSWSLKGYVLNQLGRYAEASTAHARAVQPSVNWNVFNHLFGGGLDLTKLPGSSQDLIAAIRQLNDILGLVAKSISLVGLGRYKEALTAFDAAIELSPHSAVFLSGRGFILNNLGKHEEALIALEQAIALKSDEPSAWTNRGWAKIGLGQLIGAADDFRAAATLRANDPGALEGLSVVHLSQGNWAEVERTLSERFRLPPSQHNPTKSEYLLNVIAALFAASADRGVWAHRVGRLVDIARETGALAQLGDSLVRSLPHRNYVEMPERALSDWADVWNEIAKRHTDLSLAARLFSVGVRYVQTKDQRVLLDLVQEERSILRDLFGLENETGT